MLGSRTRLAALAVRPCIGLGFGLGIGLGIGLGCANQRRDPPQVAPIIGHTYPVTTPADDRDDKPAQYGDPDAPPEKVAPKPAKLDGELLVDEIIVANCALDRGTRRMKYDGVDVHAGVSMDALAECLADPTMSGTLINVIGYSDPPDGPGLRRADEVAEALQARDVDTSRIDTYAHLPAGDVERAVIVRLDE